VGLKCLRINGRDAAAGYPPYSGNTMAWFRVQGPGFRVQGSGFRVQGSGFGVQGPGFRVQGPGISVQDYLIEAHHKVGPERKVHDRALGIA